MSLISKWLISIILLIFFIDRGFCIKCWNCRSSYDPNCADPFDNTTIPVMECDEKLGLAHLPGTKSSMCRKIRQKVNGEWHYFRDCAYLGEAGIQGDERSCLMRTGTNNTIIEYCTCNSKDGCNSSSLISPVHIVIFTLSYISRFILNIFS
ncbi:unnamed protein product [Parnassius apollo]|uniref:(apollo) hypothetical protein n=1 Tax=Parnassius apollo TaxID=110799 RepID=A0A8S3XGN9_PARAO|nr:unnamed protein product [Parnassius apollo]